MRVRATRLSDGTVVNEVLDRNTHLCGHIPEQLYLIRIPIEISSVEDECAEIRPKPRKRKHPKPRKRKHPKTHLDFSIMAVSAKGAAEKLSEAILGAINHSLGVTRS